MPLRAGLRGEFRLGSCYGGLRRDQLAQNSCKETLMSLIWIIVIVLVVLFLLGYFGRGRFSR